jgi:hypothetical protein
MLAFKMLFTVDLYEQMNPPLLCTRATGTGSDQHEVHPALTAEDSWLEYLSVVRYKYSRDCREHRFVAGSFEFARVADFAFMPSPVS